LPILCYHFHQFLLPHWRNSILTRGARKDDSLANALGVVPLISKLNSFSVHQIWHANDAAVGNLHTLHNWWECLQSIGQGFGYFPQVVKTWRLVKPHFYAFTLKIFEGFNSSITQDGWLLLFKHNRVLLHLHREHINDNDLYSVCVKTS